MGASGVGTALSAGSSLFGAMGGNNISNTNPISQENNLLTQGMNNALNYSQNYNNQAINQQNTSLNAALTELNQAMTSSTNTLTNAFNQSQALNQPIRSAGYQALNNYEDSLHMSRPEMGNEAVANALAAQGQVQNDLSGLATGQANLNALYNPNGTIDPTRLGAAPTLDAVRNTNVTPDMINQYVKGNTSADYNSNGGYFGYQSYNGVGLDSAAAGSKGGEGSSSGAVSNNPLGSWGANSPWETQNHNIGNSLAQPYLKQANSLFGQQQYNYNQLGQYLQDSYTPQRQAIANAYNSGLQNNLGVQNLYSISGGANQPAMTNNPNPQQIPRPG